MKPNKIPENKEIIIVQTNPTLQFIQKGNLKHSTLKIIENDCQIIENEVFYIISIKDSRPSDFINFQNRTDVEMGILISADWNLEKQLKTIQKWKAIFPHIFLLAEIPYFDWKYLHQLLSFCYQGFVFSTITDKEIEKLISSSNKKSEDVRGEIIIESLRNKINEIDTQLLELLHRRLELGKEIAIVKQQNNWTVLQEDRWLIKKAGIEKLAQSKNISKKFFKRIFDQIHLETVHNQLNKGAE